MDFVEVAVRAAKTGGRILARHFDALPQVHAKSAHDLVTEADFESEKAVVATIEQAFPDHGIHAEESGDRRLDSGYLWHVDPMDGTNCFVMGVPYFSVSVALAFRGETVAGAVYNPLADALYVAEKGAGAALDGKPIRVADCADCSAALAGCGYTGQPEAIREGLRLAEALSLGTRKTMVHFSPALDLCNIARGRMHAYVDAWTTPEDHAAGALVLMEAGGCVENFDRSPWTPGTRGILATNGLLHEAVAALIP